MQLDAHLSQVQDTLRSAAALGDERTQAVAAALGDAARSSVRLAVVSALSDAAGEITTALLDHPGSPTVRAHLDGEDVTFDVQSTAAPESAPPPADDGEATARISLRLTESLKSAIDDAAEREGVSVNTWLVRVAAAAARPPAAGGWSGGWSGGPAGGWAGGPWAGSRSGRRGHPDQRLNGWVSG